MMTGPERLAFLAYVERYPNDDESVHHVPAAQLAALYANAHRKEGADPFRIDAFLPFMPDPIDQLEDELDIDIAKFFMGAP